LLRSRQRSGLYSTRKPRLCQDQKETKLPMFLLSTSARQTAKRTALCL